jgi:hypothetical protein
VRHGQTWGVKEKKVPKKKPTWVEERKEKGQLEFTTLVNRRTRREKKVHPSVHHPSKFNLGSLWPKNYCFLLNHLQVNCYCFAVVIVMFKKIV